MATSTDYERQLSQLASQYQTSYNPNAQSIIRKSISDALGNYAPEYADIASREAAMPTAIGQSLTTDLPQFYGRAGFTPSALNRIQTGLGNVGTAMANLNYARNLLGAKQGRYEDVASNAMTSYLGGLQGLKDQYGMLSPMYQAALSQEEAQKQRDFEAEQRALSRASGGGGSNTLPDWNSIFGIADQQNTPVTVREVVQPFVQKMTPVVSAVKTATSPLAKIGVSLYNALPEKLQNATPNWFSELMSQYGYGKAGQ